MYFFNSQSRIFVLKTIVDFYKNNDFINNEYWQMIGKLWYKIMNYCHGIAEKQQESVLHREAESVEHFETLKCCEISI